jgi:hypothetical protein
LYKELLTASRSTFIEPDIEQTIRVHETEWVQICYVYNVQDDHEIRLVVELSLPAWVQEKSTTGPIKDMTSDDTAQLQKVLKELVAHLNYLLKLSEAGFQLEIIAEEGFWSAWTLMQGLPSRVLFHLISPP